jgi:hypothetical protein
VIKSANTHDVTVAIDTVDSMVIKKKQSSSPSSTSVSIDREIIKRRRRTRTYILTKHLISNI